LRSRVDFEALTHKAELAAEVTIQPLRRFELDAAILFSDIMTPVQGMGVDLFFDPGPVVRNPIRTDAADRCLAAAGSRARRAVRARSIKLIRPELPRGAPLIGFAGGPFTLLCYLVSGKPSKEFRYSPLVSVLAARIGRTPARSSRRCHGGLPGRPGGGRCAGVDAVSSRGRDCWPPVSSTGLRCAPSAGRWQRFASGLTCR